MSNRYYTHHCFACRKTLGELRQKVIIQREEAPVDRHPTWLKWVCDGNFYLCDSCMGKVRELLGIEVD